MPGDEPQYEYKSERTLRASEADTIAKFQSEGWELVSQQQQLLLWTELRFRRRLPQRPRRPWLLLALAMAGVATAVIVGIIHERSVADAEVFAPPASTTTDLGESEAPSAAETSTAAPTRPNPATPTGSPTRSPTVSVEPATPSPSQVNWVEVARFEGISKAYRTKKPFRAEGPVRARYRFYFRADEAYSYGELNAYAAEEDGSCGGPPLGGWRLDDKKGTQRLDDTRGRTCVNFWPPTVHWGRGNLTIIIETRR